MVYQTFMNYDRVCIDIHDTICFRVFVPNSGAYQRLWDQIPLMTSNIMVHT